MHTLPLSAFNLHSTVFFSPQLLCLIHIGKPTGMAVSHCITRFQAQLILSLRVRSATTAIVGSS